MIHKKERRPPEGIGLLRPRAAKSGKGWVDVTLAVRLVFETLQKDEIPLQLPTGSDIWGAIKAKETAKETAKRAELRKWKEVSESVGEAWTPI